MLIDKINVNEINFAEWFRVVSPSLLRCKEGDLPLFNFSNLTCMDQCSNPGLATSIFENRYLLLPSHNMTKDLKKKEI